MKDIVLIHAEIIEHIAKNTTAGVLATLLATCAVTYVLWNHAPTEILFSWLGVQCVCAGLRWFTARSLMTSNEHPQRPVNRYILVMALSGFSWGLAAVIAAIYAPLQWQMFVLAILLGIVGGAIATVSPIFRAYLAFMVCMMGLQVVAFISGGTLINNLRAALTALYIGVVFTAGRTLSRSMEHSIELRTELEVAREAAESANVAKTQFLSSVSHELRTPLNAIIGFSQLLKLDGNVVGKIHNQVSQIEKAGDHLLALVSEIIDLSRVETGQLNLHKQAVSLAESVEECLSLTQSMTIEQNISVTCNAIDRAIVLHTDPVRLQQVLLNLVSNAILIQ